MLIKVPIYVLQKIHQAVKAKLKGQGKTYSSWIREKEIEELKKRIDFNLGSNELDRESSNEDQQSQPSQ